MRAYCLELTGTGLAGLAADEVFASPRLSGPLSTVSEYELLSITRATASGFAPQVLTPRSVPFSVEGPSPDCAFTLPRLGRRANAELDRFSVAALAAHLARCLVCRAAEARHARAERAFVAVLGSAAYPAASASPPVAETVPLVAADEPAPLEPAAPEPEPAPAEPVSEIAAHRQPARGWSVLVAMLIAGTIVVVLIVALVWSSGTSGPGRHPLPPAPSASNAAVLGAVAHRTDRVRRVAARRPDPPPRSAGDGDADSDDQPGAASK